MEIIIIFKKKLIEDNLEILDHNFLSILKEWITEKLPTLKSEQGYQIALSIANLSKTIQELPEINPAKKSIYIEIAIVGYEVALVVFTKESFSQIRAEIQYDLGNAYCDRIRGDWVQNLEQAMTAFQAALRVYTYEDFPEDWASIQNNLSTVYSDYSDVVNLNKEENLELAILCCKNALRIYLRAFYPEDWAALTNLGAAYRKRLQGDRTENLKKAICCYNAALEEHTYERFPQDWAGLQNNLGNAYRELFEGNPEQNLTQSLHHFNAALKVYTCESQPQDWAMVQNNLALTYYNQKQIEQAIFCFRSSIEICTPTALPTDCLQYAGNFGDETFASGNWAEAIEGYNVAIQSLEQIRAWVKSESRRQEIIEESIDIYQNIIQACINAGQIDKAFEYSERSRSKRLVDLMASNNLSQSENIPPKVQELLQQYEELQQLIDAERQNYKSENNRSETRAVWQAYNEKIASLEADKQQIWENLRREDPVLAGEIQVQPLSLSEIQQLIDNPNTAIISFYTTKTDTHIFIVRKNQISLHTCTGEGLETFQNWIYQNWLLDYVNDSKKWESQLETILREISQRLQLSEIINQHLKGIEELIIIPHLLLHQIPFAALPTGEYQEYLVDRFLIRYTPSCQILDFCHQRLNVETFHETSLLQYGIVEDATDDLNCARWEGEQIAKMYNIPVEKRLIGKNQATVQNYRQLAEQVQILHSCHHAISCLYNPLESYLQLADGTITLGQLMSPAWRLPNLVDVFLSCCETNLGTTPLTDDILTLSTGFLCAGARSVVSSLWSVDDLATALFSIFYYQQRKQGKNRPESLKHAQIKLRELRKADLAEISNQIDEKEKELIGNRKQYTRNSVEYLKWEDQYNTHTKINRLIKQKIQTSEPEFPFAHPRYWAGFVCHGLR